MSLKMDAITKEDLIAAIGYIDDTLACQEGVGVIYYLEMMGPCNEREQKSHELIYAILGESDK